MRLAYFCFFTGALAALTGMSLGIRMGIMEDFQLAPVHAHINLLGWVTMTLFGLYHRGVQRSRNGLAWTQVCMAALGFISMTSGLAYYLSTGLDGGKPFIVAGSLLTISAMALFLIVVALDFRLVKSTTIVAASAFRPDDSGMIRKSVLSAWERS